MFGNKCTTCWWLDNRQRKPCQTHLGHQSAIPSCHIFAPRLDTFERYFQGHGVLTIVSRKERTWLCYYLTSFQIPARHVVGDGACDPGRLWSWSALFISIFIYKYCFVHSNFQIIVLCVVLSPSLHLPFFFVFRSNLFPNHDVKSSFHFYLELQTNNLFFMLVSIG